MRSINALGIWQDYALSISAFLLLPMLVLMPRGAVLVVCCAGLAAACLVWQAGIGSIRRIRNLVLLFGLLVLIGAASALWSIAPLRSLAMAGRIGGLTVAGLCLVAAAPLVRTRLFLFSLAAGAATGILLATFELASGGAISNLFTNRGFAPTRINEAATLMALLVLPLAATPLAGAWRGSFLLVAVALAVMVGVLSGTTAKLALVLGVVVAGLFYLDRRRAARVAGMLVALGVITAPLILPRLATSAAVLETADSIKTSASHRLLIWSFVGDHIAERPLLGWGLDTSRAIPGGKELFRPGQEKLPLHPHSAALQLWLELGIPGALLGTLLFSGLFFAVGGTGWPPLYAAAVGGTLMIALTALLDSFSLWNESWQAALWYSAFAVLVFARAPTAVERAVSLAPNKQAAAVGA
ncbi:MAG TPA: O-antigen ligase family protein [Stellaceae bacterium]|nr:O-antigen ligase family protein [Stellaceae bacterium]